MADCAPPAPEFAPGPNGLFHFSNPLRGPCLPDAPASKNSGTPVYSRLLDPQRPTADGHGNDLHCPDLPAPVLGPPLNGLSTTTSAGGLPPKLAANPGEAVVSSGSALASHWFSRGAGYGGLLRTGNRSSMAAGLPAAASGSPVCQH